MIILRKIRSTLYKIRFLILGAVFAIYTTIVIAENIAPSEKQLRAIKKQYGNKVERRVRRWKELIDHNQTQTELEKLKIVNNFINRIRFVNDSQHWGKADYWATPIEMLITNGGDCEDISIAKYFTLRSLGIPSSKMRLVYVKANTVNKAHMILAYYHEADSEPLILDNLDKKIKLGSNRSDLTPVYSFNGDYLWLSQQLKGRGEMIGSSTRISLWKKLRQRMKRQKRKIAIQH